MWAPSSKSHGVDLRDPRERRRHVLTLLSADWAVEWVRPLLPNTKMVGPILPQPAKALPADLQASCPEPLEICMLPRGLARALNELCYGVGQEFMEGAGESGVLVVATGTVATLGPLESPSGYFVMTRTQKKWVPVLWKLTTPFSGNCRGEGEEGYGSCICNAACACPVAAVRKGSPR